MIDDNLSNNYGEENYYYESLKRDFCPTDSTRLSFSEKFNEWICSSCGYVRPDDEAGTTTSSNAAKGATMIPTKQHISNPNALGAGAEETAENVFIIPIQQRRYNTHKQPPWSNDDDVMRLVNKGAQIKDYRELIPDDSSRGKTFNPAYERDPYFSERDREQRISQGNYLSTSNTGLENRRTFKRQ